MADNDSAFIAAQKEAAENNRKMFDSMKKARPVPNFANPVRGVSHAQAAVIQRDAVTQNPNDNEAASFFHWAGRKFKAAAPLLLDVGLGAGAGLTALALGPEFLAASAIGEVASAGLAYAGNISANAGAAALVAGLEADNAASLSNKVGVDAGKFENA